MAKEEKSVPGDSEKLDIEDIKDPEEEAKEAAKSDGDNLDIEEVVLEESVSSDIEEAKEAGAKEESKVEEAPKPAETKAKTTKPEKPKKDRKILKSLLIIVLTMLVTTALVLGGVWWYLKKQDAKKNVPASQEQNKTDQVEEVQKPTETKIIYVNEATGLRLRKDANSSADILDTMPFGTKLTVLDTKDNWYKVEYNGQTGWCDSAYTSANDPLTYKNTDYGFQMTFLSDWGGYKLFPITADSSATAAWYVGIPTTDTAYSATGVEKGYSSLFAISLYTKDQWQKVSAEEGPKPTKITENDKYVVAYSLPNGTPPKDLATQAKAAKSIALTLKFN